MWSKVTALVSLLVATSCSGGGGGGGSGTTGNHAPVADAGPDQDVTTGVLVTLDGLASSDSDGDLLTYRWSFDARPQGSKATLSSTLAVQPTFVADVDGSYVLTLIVDDGQAFSLADTVTVTAATQNSAPVADAGPDQNVVTRTVVTLDGSASSDADRDSLAYHWSFDARPEGSKATLSSTLAVQPTFVADVDGSYVLSLIVDDGQATSLADTVTVTAATQNSAPVADAGRDRSVVTGTLVTLDGSGSSDANGDPLTYEWSFVSMPAGSSAVLSSTTAVHPTFTADREGSYVISLVVSDGIVTSVPDTVTVAALGGQCAIAQEGGGADGVAVLPDGRIITVSGSIVASAVYRFDSDTTGGEVIASFTDNAQGVAVQADGKILVVGRSSRGPLNTPNVMLRRYDSDGVADSSFGSGGVVFYNDGPWVGGKAVAVQPDGKLVVTGFRDNGTDRDVLLLRYHSDGTLDASFGTGGVIVYDSGNYEFGGNDIALQPDGKILVVSTVEASTQDVLLLRFTKDGQLDSSFGVNGVVTSDGGEWDAGDAIEVQPDGRIVVVGARGVGDQGHVLLLRYGVTGSPDPTFGSAGAVVGDPGHAYAVALQPDGRIVVAGETSVPGILFSAALVTRYDGSGSLDSSFGSDGSFVYNSSDGADRIAGLDLGTGGSIIAAGASNYLAPYGASPGQQLLMRLFDVCR